MAPAMDTLSPPPPPLPSSPPPAPTAKLTPETPPHHYQRYRHSHQHASNRHSRRSETPSRRKSAPAHATNMLSSTTAASPEVINSLVDQLSKLQPSPLHNPYLYGSLAPPGNGAPPISDGEGIDYLHPDDAAMAPVVRTSKPPSGYSSHTKADSFTHSRRSSLHSGLGVGVDIPSYVRTYMNRPPEHERRLSRDSSVSVGAGSGRLSYASSRERMRMERRAREKERASAGMVGSAGGKEIPQRSSSYGKGGRSPTRKHYPEPIVTTSKPLYTTPIGSPSFAPNLTEEEDGGGAAPAPDLPRNRDPTLRKRRSRGYPKRSESLPAQNRGSTSRHSAEGTNYTHQATSPNRPSFQSSAADTSHERPGSADSIDDAVDAYLCSPRLSQKIRMPTTGRSISFSEVGDPQGFAVFVCVGMGLTRYVTAFYDELALTLGLRLITPDRPGVGESDSIDESERAVLNWPDDVLYICQSLKITKFSILAHSAGAIYALATALRMPGHIRGKIHLLAPWIPPSQMESVVSTGDNKGEKAGSIPTSQRILRALPTPILKAANSSFMSATSSSLTTSLPRTNGRRTKRRSATPAPQPAGVGPKDRPTLTTNHVATAEEPAQPAESTPEQIEASLLLAAISAAQEKERQSSYDERLTSAIWALSTRNANPAVDLLVCLERNRPVGFRYVDIVREVVIHHGMRDTRVPVENVKWLGKTMRRCEVRLLPTEGHGLMASALVMGGVLEEIANEWRDWRKVVEGRRVEGGGRERRWAD